MIEIILARHGKTENNELGILQGTLDTKLNLEGLRDAKNLAKHLKKIYFDTVFSSDLLRAMQCSNEIIKYQRNKKIIKEPLLRERFFGEHQGVKITDLGYKDLSYPEMCKHLYECSCPNGESNTDLVGRINIFLDKLKKYDNEKILIVTHGGVVMLMLNQILKEKIIFENARKHKNGYVSYLKLDPELNVVNSLLNVHCSNLEKYIKN
jgi:broad specificity phosphatase PhoE